MAEEVQNLLPCGFPCRRPPSPSAPRLKYFKLPQAPDYGLEFLDLCSRDETLNALPDPLVLLESKNTASLQAAQQFPSLICFGFGGSSDCAQGLLLALN